MLNKHEVEEPKCCCGCSVRTGSIILGILSLISIGGGNPILGCMMGVVYLGVAFMNTSAWVKSASTVVYILAVLDFICFIICIIFIVRSDIMEDAKVVWGSRAIACFIGGAFNYYMSTLFAQYAEYLEHKEKEEARVVVNF